MRLMPYKINQSDFDQIISSEGAIRTGANKANVRCPAHHDRNASCSVELRGENFLVYCHTGCNFRDVIDGFKGQGYELRAEAPGVEKPRKKQDKKPIAKPAPKPQKTERKPRGDRIRSHTYHDQNGRELYRQVKFENGWMREHRTEAGDWKPGSGETKPTLYELPKLIKAIQARKTIVIHEGEKDADATNERSDGSIFATTSGGASSWRSEFVGLFQVENPPKVVVIGDEDDPKRGEEKPGEKFARDVVQSFIAAGLPVARFKLPRWFNGAKIKDVADYYEAKGTFESIKQVCESAHLISAFESEEEGFKVRLGSALERLQWPEEDELPVLPGVFELGGVVQIVGASKARKSFFALQLALCASLGEEFLAFQVKKPQKVLYLNYELQTKWANARLRAMVNGLQVNLKKYPDNLTIADMELAKPDVSIVRRMALEYKPDVLVIDPIYPLIAQDENNTDSWGDLLRELKNIARFNECAVIYVHHDPKGDSSSRKLVDRGSGSSIQARHYDAGLYLGPHNDGESTILEFIVRNYKPLDAETIRFNKGAFWLQSHIPPEHPLPNQQKKALDVLEYLDFAERILEEKGPLPYGDFVDKVRDETSLGKNRAERVVKELAESGRIRADRRGRKTVYSSFYESDSDVF